MKKIVLCILTFLPLLTLANPMETPPPVKISEIQFFNNGKWVIELLSNEMSGSGYMDSIFIETSSGIAKITNTFDSEYEIIRVDSLSKPLTINRDSDFVRLIIYPFYSDDQDILQIGKFKDSYLKTIPDGYSIASLGGVSSPLRDFSRNYVLDSTPTIGTENTFDGVASGYVYGKILGLPNHGSFKFTEGYYSNGNSDWCNNIVNPWHETGIYPDVNSNYCIKLTTRNYTFNELLVCIELVDYGYFLTCNPTSFYLNPGDSIRIDLSLLTSTLKLAKKITSKLYNYPNPAKDETLFVLDLSGLKSKSLILKIYDGNGTIVKELVPTSETMSWNCSALPQGTYIYTLEADHLVVGTGKLLIER